MNYEESLDWLFSQLPMFSRIGAAAYKPGLETTENLDRLFGHPHKKFKSIHVGGTNGKGSTSHMLAAVLQEQGYKTGLYTSPHLTDFRERIRINGKMMPKEAVVRFVENWKSRQREMRPSFFELTMMMAFDWFAAQNVDYAVIEVGMGGRLDSTNVISPELSIITNISFDHTQFLGNTLTDIAREKAGIIKKGIPVVIGEAKGEIREVFEKAASLDGSPIYFAEEESALCDLERRPEGWEVRIGNESPFTVPLAGVYQKHNIRTVLCSLDILTKEGIEISFNSIRSGLEKVKELTGLRGRWQKVSCNPDVICDTGHNIAGLSETLSTLRELYPDRKVLFVIGFVNDKDVDHIVGLFPKDGQYYFTQANIPRAMDALEVEKKFSSVGIKGKVSNSVEEAFLKAKSDAGPDDVIYVGGSTFIVADFLALSE